MNRFLLLVMMWVGLIGAPAAETAGCAPLLAYKAIPLEGGAAVDFCDAYRGKVILAVNTASQCGYTGQLKGLEALYQRYRAQGLVVLGFPSNDFNQEHANPAMTASVARTDHGVTFPLYQSSSVKGEKASAFFAGLGKASGTPPSWNFFKYLVGRNGAVIKAYPSSVTPEDPLLNLAIEAALAESP